MAMGEDTAADVDLYAGVDEFSTDNQNTSVDADLYEDVLSSKNDDKAESQFLASQEDGQGVEYKSYTTVHPKSAIQQQKEAKIAANLHQDRRGKAVYVGNLSWWTTDEELTSRIQDCGVTDLNNIKFFENRVNGQSKGFALVEIGSETSQRLIIDKLPKQDIHDQKPVVTYVTKHNLANFEQMSRKVKPGVGAAGGDFKNVTDSSGLAPGVIGRTNMNRGPQAQHGKQQGYRPSGPGHHDMGIGMPYMGPGGPPMRPMGPGMPPMMNGPPFDPAFHGFMPGMPPPGMPPMQPDPAFMMSQGYPPTAAAFPSSVPNRVEFPGTFPQAPKPPVSAIGSQSAFMGGPPDASVPVSDAYGGYAAAAAAAAGMPASVSQASDALAYQRSAYPSGAAAATAESEMELMRYNQAVASTALQRAMADAGAGDFETGIETLVTAISLIKQSGTSNSESSNSLVLSLQDCLHRLEAQLITRTGPGGSSSRSKDRGYSPADDYRDDRRGSGGHRRRHRSRSRSRSRERRSWSPRDQQPRSRERRRR